MHQPLLTALSTYRQGQLLAGTRLFHGSLDRTNGTSDGFNPLSGTKKWLSESIVSASEYAYDGAMDDDGFTLRPADRYLWVCEVFANIPALIGSQFALRSLGPWQECEFPHKFPNEFSQYARDIFGSSSSYAFLDFMQKNFMDEVLVTHPANALRILERIDLPESKPEAQAYLTARFPDAAAF